MTNYSIILADPPWHFQNWAAGSLGETHARASGAAKHYPTMTIEEICALPVGDLAAKDSVLLLWACWPLLSEALQVFEAWGFAFKTRAWVWVKMNRSGLGLHMGGGYHSRASDEPCLLGIRGKGLPRLNADVLGIILSPVREHSRKPDEQYDKIARLFGDVPRIELFARHQWPGWDVWGNEVSGSIDLALPSEAGEEE